MAGNFEFSVEQEGDIYIVLIGGRVDATTAPTLEKKLAKIEEIAMKMAIDFSQVDYLSSAGMRLLLVLTKKMGAKGGKVAYFGMADSVLEIIKMAGFERILKIFSNKSEALKSLQ